MKTRPIDMDVRVAIDDHIKKCPRCGSGEVSVFHFEGDFKAQCDECEKFVIGATEDQAIRLWNALAN